MKTINFSKYEKTSQNTVYNIVNTFEIQVHYPLKLFLFCA